MNIHSTIGRAALSGGASAVIQPTPVWLANANVIAATSGTTVTCPLPTGIAAGDILIMQAGCIGSSTQFSVPAGWTLLSDITEGSDEFGFWWKIAGASETAPVVTNSGRTSTNLLTASMLAFRGASGLRGSAVQNGSDVNMQGPSVSTTGRNSLAVSLFMRLGANTSSTPDGAWTSVRNNGTSGGGGGRFLTDTQDAAYPGTLPGDLQSATGATYSALAFELYNDSTSPSPPAKNWRRGMWVWSFETVITGDTGGALITAATAASITDLYCYSEAAFFAANAAAIASFAASASAAGIRCWGLDGARTYFADADGPAGLYANIQGVIDYNAAQAAASRFYGFVLDMEPPDADGYTTFHNGIASPDLSTAPDSGVWKNTQAEDREALMENWVSIHAASKALANGAGMKLGSSLPDWLFNYYSAPIPCTFNGVTQNVWLYLVPQTDLIAIMSYNTNIETVIGLLEDYFTQGCTVPMGFSADVVAGDGSGVSWADTPALDSKAVVEAGLGTWRSRWSGYPNVIIDSLEDWAGWDAMPA